MIPHKRPRVSIGEDSDDRVRVLVEGLRRPVRVRARCEVGGCDWTYSNVVKTDVEQKASWHRAEHREAAPQVEP